MNLNQFNLSIAGGQLPEELTPYLTAMWYEKRGDWDQSHRIVQDIETATASWIHAYLHRREGDESNARYWYSRAGRSFPSGLTLDDEWTTITAVLLESR